MSDRAKSEGELAMDILGASARVIAELPLEDLLTNVERAETLGPILEPTAYMRGGRKNLEDQRDLLTAALAVKRAVGRIKTRHPQPGVSP